MTWEILIKIGHIVGTVLGVGGATFAEIFHYQATKGGGFDQSYAAPLRITYSILRWGMILLVVSGFGYLLLLRFEGHAQYIYGPRVLSKLTITGIILLNAILLQTKKNNFTWGSTISIVSWYAALIIGSWRGLPANFWGIMGIYIAMIILVAQLKRIFTKTPEAKL